VLQASGQIHLLEPYHRSVGTRLIKSPKLYYMDVGLACYLLGIGDEGTLRRSHLSGSLWESFVIGEMIRRVRMAGQPAPLWFWRTAHGAEVDLLVEGGGRFIAVECKLTEHPGVDSLHGLRSFAAEYGTDALDQAFVAARPAHPYRIGAGPTVRAVTVADLVEELGKEERLAPG
jgi:predicted AAA+ superfamily ATPase